MEHSKAIDTRHCLIMIVSESFILTAPWKFQEPIPLMVMNNSLNDTWPSNGHILSSKEFDTKLITRKLDDHQIIFFVWN